MTPDEAFDDPGPDRTLPKLTWLESVEYLLAQDNAVMVKWRRRAYESVMRVSAKTDVHGNYKN